MVVRPLPGRRTPGASASASCWHQDQSGYVSAAELRSLFVKLGEDGATGRRGRVMALGTPGRFFLTESEQNRLLRRSTSYRV